MDDPPREETTRPAHPDAPGHARGYGSTWSLLGLAAGIVAALATLAALVRHMNG